MVKIYRAEPLLSSPRVFQNEYNKWNGYLYIQCIAGDMQLQLEFFISRSLKGKDTIRREG